MDTPFQTDSHRNLWLWFPPQMAGMKRTVIHISRPKDPTKGLRNKKVPLRNLWTKQRSITHISYQMCYVALVKTKMWSEKREEPASPSRQVVWVLSACPMTPILPVPPSLTCTALVSYRGLRKSLCSIIRLWASLNWTRGSQQQAVSVALSWLKWLADTGTCALTMRDERAAWQRPLFCLSENTPLLSAEVNKRPNKTEWKQSKASLPNDL